MNKCHLILGVLLALGCIVAGACGGLPVYVDRGLAQGIPCQPPCWEGLIPGISTEEEVRQTLERLQKSGQIPPYDEASGPRQTMYRIGKDWEGGIEILTENGKLALIVGKVGFDLDAQQLIDRMGAPRAVTPAQLGVTTTCACAAQHARATPSHWYGHHPNSGSSLHYPEKGMIFTIAVPPQDEGCICPYMKVTAFSYTPPMATVQEQGQYWVNFHLHSATVHESDFVPWHGFGSGYLQVMNP